MKIEDIKAQMQSAFFGSSDLLFRDIKVSDISCTFSFIDGGSDKQLLEQDVILPLMRICEFEKPYFDSISASINYSEQIKQCTIDEAPMKIAEGDIAFFVEDDETAYILSMRKFEKRSITEPPTASVLKGPREGFIEEIKTNISLLRRRLKTPNLVVKNFQVGRFSTTSVALLYIDGIASPDIVEELTAKIEAIDIDGIVDSAYISSFIESHKHSIFNQTGTTEKPDVASAKLLEGRVAIVVDGTPIVVTVPYVVLEDLQDGYDYYSRDWRASMVRVFRLLGALLTVLLPGAYVALQTFHFHLLPMKFLITILSATVGIPFPPAIEMLFVLILFEILNQASVRMPRFMGISLSVVGAIVLGDTAVKAGLISSPAVLVMALSAIGIFCVPEQVGSLSILRFGFLCISSVLGLLGMIIFVLMTLAYLASLENFGTPYLAPFAPRINPDLKDAFLKNATVDMYKRPFSIPTKNRTRLNNEALKEES